MPTCISYVVSAMEAVGLLLCVTHIAEHLKLHTEPCRSSARANAERKQQRGGECFDVSAVQRN
jgi:hypothetical protein